jgi:alcohol dehydrogenase class IV
VRFEFATAARIVFGPGAAKEIAPAAREMGTRALLVTGRTPARAEPLARALISAGVECMTLPVEKEPTVDWVESAVAAGRRERCDLVIGFGGGSAMDAAKAVAALLPNAGEVFDYLEVIGQGQPLARPSLPLIAVPTTAGTGAEVTRNAVLASPRHKVKVSLRSPHMLPRLAVVDPELTYDLPPAVTASTGMDALTQLLEPYVSSRANPMTDALCVEGLRRVARSLPRAHADGSDQDAREDMSLASLFGGLALANAGLGAVHGFAAAIGGAFEAPHGAVCAALLPHVVSVNLRALRSRAPRSEALDRYRDAARILTGRSDADCAEWLVGLCQSLGIPRLGSYGIAAADAPAIVESAARARSMKANPIVLTPEELLEILAAAI